MIALSLLISMFAKIFTGETSFLSVFSILSCILSVITTYFVIKLYDEFDSKKVKFAKTVNAVDELVAKITSIPFCLNYFKVGTITNMTEKSTVRVLNRQAAGRVYIDEAGIQIMKKTGNAQFKVFFTTEFLDYLSEPNLIFYNPWLPKEIKEALKGPIVFNAAKPISVNPIKEEFIIISNKFMDSPIKDFSYYKLSYDSAIHNKKIEIFTLEDLIIYHENLIKTLGRWYEKNMNTKPDFSGF